MRLNWKNTALILAITAAPAWAQTSPFYGSVPQGEATAQPLALSAKETVTRALQYNLGLILQQEGARSATGARGVALADLRPQFTGSLGERRQVLNLEAFGFPAPDPIVGPFNVFDVRVGVSQPLLDLRAWHAAKAASFEEKAATLGIKSARELVVLLSMDLYLEAIAAESRIEVVRAQQETAAQLLKQAQDLKASGLVAGIDVVRAEVQVQNQRQRRIQADNNFEKAKLKLARAIGLPPGQVFTLTDKIPYAPLDGVTLDKALADAYAQRADYLAARERLSAAEASQQATAAQLLPSLRLDADYGTIGQEAGNAHPTYTLAATVRVPIFEGGRTQAKKIEADAVARQRRAEYDDLRGRIDMDVRTAMLDLNAATQQLEAVQTTVALANQELAQARDRLAAGVSGNLEVVQAQETVATAADHYIEALYGHNVAKATLARAVGGAEVGVMNFLGGAR
ncbi:MAG: TolC family protein [Vicinamibacterales bacterium]